MVPKHPPGGRFERPPGGYFTEFGFLLGPAPFLTTFLAYVLRRPKTIILPLFEIFGIWAVYI